jgi:hypothetical protein
MNRHTQHLNRVAVGTLLVLAASTAARGSAGIDWYTIDGGSGTATGGGYVLSGTAGQPEAGTMSDWYGTFILSGGYWTGIGAEPCEAIAARSCLTHGVAGRLCLELGVNDGVEPRLGGITELEIDLDSAAGFSGGVTVNCSAPWSGIASGVAAADIVTVTFTLPLPDQSYCTIELDCGAAVCVRSLAGDVDRSGLVTTADASIIKPQFGTVPTDATCQFDYDISGLVTTSDFSMIKPKFGNSAPTCP